MMQTITRQLANWGVPKQDILTEAFGPASGKATGKGMSVGRVTSSTQQTVGTSQVTFARHGIQVGWTGEANSLLDFALANGVKIDSGCRAGSCGTCLVAIKSGRVNYIGEHKQELDEGTCLTCISEPDGDLVLDV